MNEMCAFNSFEYSNIRTKKYFDREIVDPDLGCDAMRSIEIVLAIKIQSKIIIWPSLVCNLQLASSKFQVPK